MLVELHSKIEAKRLELNGFRRIGAESVEAELNQLDDLLDRDDVTVDKVVLDRSNSGDEAQIIDDYILAGVPDRNRKGEVVETHFKAAFRDVGFKTRERKILEAEEDTLRVFRRFREAIHDGPLSEDQYDREGFEDVRDKLSQRADEQIAEHQQSVENLRERKGELESLAPEDVDD